MSGAGFESATEEREHIIKFGQIYLSTPVVAESDGNTKTLYPTEARLRNLRRIWLNVNSDNERAVRSYKAVGFVEEGRQRQHVWSNGRYIDLVCMGLLREEWNG